MQSNSRQKKDPEIQDLSDIVFITDIFYVLLF